MKRILLVILAIFALLAVFLVLAPEDSRFTAVHKIRRLFVAKSELTTARILRNDDFYSQKVQPIFDGKCVACHSCFNSPCQLNLTAYEGISRGANKISIYDFPKLKAREPTRLFIDGRTHEEWKAQGFFPVTRVTKGTGSILDIMTGEIPGIESGLQNTYDAEKSRTCVAAVDGAQIAAFTKANPAGRMPFGLPKLDELEVSAIKSWQDEGAQGPSTLEQEKRVRDHAALSASISDWEAFFNRGGLQARLSSRYLFEHLFLAHLYFETHPQIFFRLVRSKTLAGDIQEIATDMPFDFAGDKFFYRLRPVIQTLVHKSHIPYGLTSRKMKKWDENFYKSRWEKIPKEMPAYGAKGSNPFLTFAAIPVKARYEFFLEDAGYHVMTFIKGPVCRGQAALNVINDQFWVMFVDPSKDVLANSPETYDAVAPQMEMPARIGDKFEPFIDFRKKYWNALKAKFDRLEKDAKPLGTDWIWDGGTEHDSNALLTVFRHFDSATVLRGLHGDVPKTVWLIDYQVFESIYYNLTAGYNVFGPLLHQLNSRLYMEISRIGSEDLFLTLLPTSLRGNLRSNWSTPTPRKKEGLLEKVTELFTGDVEDKMKFDYAYQGAAVASSFEVKSKEPVREIVESILESRFRRRLGKPVTDERLAKMKVEDFAGISGLPDTLLLRVGKGTSAKLYTLIHNKAHFNVSMILFEDERRNPANDTLSLVEGVGTSYANLFLTVEERDLEKFVEEFNRADSSAAVWNWMSKYAVSRSNPKFWEEYKWFSDRTTNRETNETGLLDLNRYLNI